jgi:glycosyltransferase involved in cell wall biosynthesis
MFETDRLPNNWVDRLNFMDEIWVPTDFSRKIFESEGVKKGKIKVLGEPVDSIFFSPQEIGSHNFDKVVDFGGDNPTEEEKKTINLLKDIRERRENGYFVFLFVGKWEERKGVRFLIRAYCSAFKRG